MIASSELAVVIIILCLIVTSPGVQQFYMGHHHVHHSCKAERMILSEERLLGQKHLFAYFLRLLAEVGNGFATELRLKTIEDPFAPRQDHFRLADPQALYRQR